MHGHFFTLVKKVTAGDLLPVLFCLIALGYALTGLFRQTSHSQNLETPSAVATGRESARMKEHLKSPPGSNYLRNRRQRLG